MMDWARKNGKKGHIRVHGGFGEKKGSEKKKEKGTYPHTWPIGREKRVREKMEKRHISPYMADWARKKGQRMKKKKAHIHVQG